MTLTDKTGAPVTVTKEADRFSVAVDGRPAGLTVYLDHNGQRVFPHTEIDEAYGGRGLATVLIREALATTRADGLRIVPVCPMVVGYVAKHHDFDDIIDDPTPELIDWLESR